MARVRPRTIGGSAIAPARLCVRVPLDEAIFERAIEVQGRLAFCGHHGSRSLT